MKACVLTIGTEITIGEIVNSNAAWISQQLEDRGYAVMEHLSVRDEGAAIISALKRFQKADVIIVSGGLGPTSDDITREMLAKWIKKPLVFSDKVWRDLNTVYQQRALPIRPAHRHQCYFPKGAKIINNPVGTAHGFYIKNSKSEVFVLPGPPRELEGMWEHGVAPKLKKGDSLPWTYWTVLGMPESEVAEVIEPLIEELNLEVGYRASVPYVHIKLRGKKMSAALEAKVDESLQKHLVSKGQKDFALGFWQQLKEREVLFQDQATRGALSTRLANLNRLLPGMNIKVEDCWGEQRFSPSSPETCGQIMKVVDDPCAVDVTWRNKGRMQKARIQLPFKIKLDSERGAQSAAEWAIFKWWQWTKD